MPRGGPGRPAHRDYRGPGNPVFPEPPQSRQFIGGYMGAGRGLANQNYRMSGDYGDDRGPGYNDDMGRGPGYGFNGFPGDMNRGRGRGFTPDTGPVNRSLSAFEKEMCNQLINDFSGMAINKSDVGGRTKEVLVEYNQSKKVITFNSTSKKIGLDTTQK